MSLMGIAGYSFGMEVYEDDILTLKDEQQNLQYSRLHI